MMRITIASSIASLILLCNQAQGQGSLLEKRFAIGGPEFEYDSWQFTMDFEVSDLMKDNMIMYSLYDGMDCKDGGDNEITENDGYLLSKIRTDNTPVGDGSGIRTIKVQSMIVASKLAESGIYEEDDDGNGVVEFCLRFNVYNTDRDDPRAMQVNFLEIPVRLSIELESDFGLNANVDTIEVLQTEASQGVAVEAYLCDHEDNVMPIIATEQGQTVRVCVTPTPDILAQGLRLRQLEQFSFRREIPISTKQEAIKAGTGGGPASELTIVSCRPGSVICAFETLLYADFFSAEGVISGQGLSFLQFGTDESTDARRLALSPEQEFEQEAIGFSISIKLVPLDSNYQMEETVSSAPTKVTSFMATVLLAIGLIF